MNIDPRSGFAMILASVALALSGCNQEKQTSAAANEAASAIRTAAQAAYIYGYPLVLMDASRAKLTNVPHPIGAGLAPVNQFGHIRTFPDATFTDIVSPNADTL